MAEDPPITFYRLQACPFCERIARKLRELDVPYRSRYVRPNHSERDVVKRVAGVRTVPVIVDERTGVTMAESDNVAEYLDATYGPEAATDGGARIGDAGSGADATDGGGA